MSDSEQRLTVASSGPEQTREIGRRIGEVLPAGARLALIGSLGAGKTCLTQGLIRGLGAPTEARSPSYVLVHEHEGRCPIYHCDWYRLENPDDVISTGFEDFLTPQSVVIVEWGDRFPDWIGSERLEISIETTESDTRQLFLEDRSDSRLYASALKEVSTLCAF